MTFHSKYSSVIRLLPFLASAAFVPLLSNGQPIEMAASTLADTSYSEYSIKAGFIYKFLSFVTWPANASDDGTITIAIIGNNPFGTAFKAIEGKTVDGRVVNIKFLNSRTDYNELKSCQILYISRSEELNMKNILESLENSATLTVSDSQGFIDQGGMIGFVTKNKDQIGIEINSRSASRAGLTIRSMLKRIAMRLIE